MTQEDKQLLLKDLCARVPYDTVVKVSELGDVYLDSVSWFEEVAVRDYTPTTYSIEDVKPYLRSMSSMTEKEKEEYNKTRAKIAVQWDDYGTPIGYEYAYTVKTFDWLNEHHFDYRGLIPMGLALEAPEGMYKTE